MPRPTGDLARDAKAMRRALDARSVAAGPRIASTGRAVREETTRTARVELPCHLQKEALRIEAGARNIWHTLADFDELICRMANTLRPRTVRLPAEGVSADIRGGKGEAINISGGGALLRTDCAPEVGSEQRLVLVKGDHRVAVDSVVLRVTPDFSLAEPDQRWLVAVRFQAEPAEMRRVVSKLLEPPTPTRAVTRPGVVPPRRS